MRPVADERQKQAENPVPFVSAPEHERQRARAGEPEEHPVEIADVIGHDEHRSARGDTLAAVHVETVQSTDDQPPNGTEEAREYPRENRVERAVRQQAQRDVVPLERHKGFRKRPAVLRWECCGKSAVEVNLATDIAKRREARRPPCLGTYR